MPKGFIKLGKTVWLEAIKKHLLVVNGVRKYLSYINRPKKQNKNQNQNAYSLCSMISDL